MTSYLIRWDQRDVNFWNIVCLPELMNPPISWCKLEVWLTGPDCVSVCTDHTLSAPPLVIMSLNLRTLPNTKTHQNEVGAPVCLCCLCWDVMSLYQYFSRIATERCYSAATQECSCRKHMIGAPNPVTSADTGLTSHISQYSPFNAEHTQGSYWYNLWRIWNVAARDQTRPCASQADTELCRHVDAPVESGLQIM